MLVASRMDEHPLNHPYFGRLIEKLPPEVVLALEWSSYLPLDLVVAMPWPLGESTNPIANAVKNGVIDPCSPDSRICFDDAYQWPFQRISIPFSLVAKTINQTHRTWKDVPEYSVRRPIESDYWFALLTRASDIRYGLRPLTLSDIRNSVHAAISTEEP